MSNTQDDNDLLSLIDAAEADSKNTTKDKLKVSKSVAVKKKERMSEEVRFRIEPSLHKTISKLAKKSGTNLSDFCRQIIIAEVQD